MIYNTNHSTIHKSCWDDKPFLGEVMVYFNDILTNDILDDNKLKLEDLDFQNLTETIIYFDKLNYEDNIEFFKENNKPYNEEVLKKRFYKKTKKLKPHVLEWLNDNIKDDIDGNKMWAIPNDEYFDRTHNIVVGFGRQIDALKFINTFSIYKEPTFYFDYFNNERKDINITKLNKIMNTNINIAQEPQTIFNYYDCKLMDWERKNTEAEEAEIDLTKEEVKNIIEQNIEKSGLGLTSRSHTKKKLNLI